MVILNILADVGGAILVMLGGMLLLCATYVEDYADLPPYDDGDAYFHYWG